MSAIALNGAEGPETPNRQLKKKIPLPHHDTGYVFGGPATL
jgi:hypothetical protein